MLHSNCMHSLIQMGSGPSHGIQISEGPLNNTHLRVFWYSLVIIEKTGLAHVTVGYWL